MALIPGPFKVGRTPGRAPEDDPVAYVFGDSTGDIVCYAKKSSNKPIGVQLNEMRRIAAALNAVETEESRRSSLKAADERMVEACKGDSEEPECTDCGRAWGTLHVPGCGNQYSATGVVTNADCKRRPARGGAK